jgi:general secretion pathway protein F
VAPKFAEVYRDAGRNLPWLSQLLLNWGNVVAARPITFAVGSALFFITLVIMLRYLMQTGAMARLAYQFPGLGERMRIYELARLYLTLGTLLEGGIPIVAALTTTQSSVTTALQHHLQAALQLIQSGIPVSVAFESHQLTTPISVRMLRVGERSGELGLMLAHSAAFYDDEINRWVDRFTRLFEPLLMTAIGIVVGGIVVLLYLPIFDLAQSLS